MELQKWMCYGDALNVTENTGIRLQNAKWKMIRVHTARAGKDSFFLISRLAQRLKNTAKACYNERNETFKIDENVHFEKAMHETKKTQTVYSFSGVFSEKVHIFPELKRAADAPEIALL